MLSSLVRWVRLHSCKGEQFFQGRSKYFAVVLKYAFRGECILRGSKFNVTVLFLLHYSHGTLMLYSPYTLCKWPTLPHWKHFRCLRLHCGALWPVLPQQWQVGRIFFPCLGWVTFMGTCRRSRCPEGCCNSFTFFAAVSIDCASSTTVAKLSLPGDASGLHSVANSTH